MPLPANLRASDLLANGLHSLPAFISDSELRNRVSGRTFAEWLVAREAVDSQEARRAWRAGK